MRSVFFAGRESISVNFKEEHANDESRAFVAIEKWMVTHNSDGVRGGHGYDVDLLAVGVKLTRSGQSGFEQALIADSRWTSIESEKTRMEREGVALIHPQRLAHLESAWSVLR